MMQPASGKLPPPTRAARPPSRCSAKSSKPCPSAPLATCTRSRLRLSGPPTAVTSMAQRLRAAFEGNPSGSQPPIGLGGSPAAATCFALAFLAVSARPRRRRPRPRLAQAIFASVHTSRRPRPASPQRRPWGLVVACLMAGGVLSPVAGSTLSALSAAPAGASVSPSVANDVYTVAGPGPSTWAGDGGPATSAFLNGPGQVAFDSAGDLYVADTANNRVQEVPASSGTYWGQSMSAGDAYTVVGEPTGVAGYSPNGTAAHASLLEQPDGIALDSQGDLYIADFAGNTVQEVAYTSHSQWGLTMTGGTSIPSSVHPPAPSASPNGTPCTAALVTGQCSASTAPGTCT